MRDIRKLDVCVNTMLNTFYVHNLMTHLAKTTQTNRHPRAVEIYQEELRGFSQETIAEYAEILFSYLVIASTGEVRHLRLKKVRWYKKLFGSKKNEVRVGSVLRKSGVALGANKNERGITQEKALDYLLASDTLTTKSFLETLVAAFNDLGWEGSMGGRVWGKIAKAAMDYQTGELDSTRFLDLAFTLRHHGGRLFDKHFSFSFSTKENELSKQLVVQDEAKSISELSEKLRDIHPFIDPRCIYFFQRGATFGYWEEGLDKQWNGLAAIQQHRRLSDTTAKKVVVGE